MRIANDVVELVQYSFRKQWRRMRSCQRYIISLGVESIAKKRIRRIWNIEKHVSVSGQLAQREKLIKKLWCPASFGKERIGRNGHLENTNFSDLNPLALLPNQRTPFFHFWNPKHTLFPQGFLNIHCFPRDSQTYIVSQRLVPQGFPSIHSFPVIPKHTLFPQGFPNINCSPRDSQTYIVS